MKDCLPFFPMGEKPRTAILNILLVPTPLFLELPRPESA